MYSNALAGILSYSEQVPNWAPNERFLPNADYGRVGALKLAKNVFDSTNASAIDAYLSNIAIIPRLNAWAELGKYHFYILAKDKDLEMNEHIRVGLPAAPVVSNFIWPTVNLPNERDGPHYQREVLMTIAEIARTYGFSTQTLMSAILTLIKGKIRINSPDALGGVYKEGYLMAKYNFGLLESLFGVRSSGYPQTYRETPGGGIASRRDYGGGKRGKRGKKKRRRYY